MYFMPAMLLAGRDLFWIIFVVALFIIFISIIFFALRKRGHETAPTAERKVGPATIESDESDELIAVLTAAAHETLKAPVIVKSFTFLSNTENPMWSVSGRINIMASHLISKRKP